MTSEHAKVASLYADLMAAGVPVDNHESDLYCKDTPDARAILKRWGKSGKPFLHQVTGELWFDVPFMFDPFWEGRIRAK